eukprot:gene9063-1159_t
MSEEQQIPKTENLKIKKSTHEALTDDDLIEKINQLTMQRENLSHEIKKLRNRYNARVFKAKKKAVVSGTETKKAELLTSDVTS